MKVIVDDGDEFSFHPSGVLQLQRTLLALEPHDRTLSMPHSPCRARSKADASFSRTTRTTRLRSSGMVS